MGTRDEYRIEGRAAHPHLAGSGWIDAVRAAAAAYVTRQSVGNWERGNTLPDVQSLQLVAKALNTTVDGLLGDELPDMLEETAEARRQLTHCLAALGAIFALELLLAFLYSSFLRAPGSGEFRLVLSG